MGYPEKGIVSLRISPRKCMRAAEEYYGGLLGEYYRKLGKARWLGKGCSELQLEGDVRPDEFTDLLRNINPQTGQRLTTYTRQGRIVGWDMNFHCPKSVSVQALVTGDRRLIDSFSESVEFTLNHMEAHIEARVRLGTASTDRRTGNMICARFPDFISRPEEGKSDPLLHAHNFIVNATKDDTAGKWKAVKIRAVVEQAPVWQALFHVDLARRVRDLGYRLAWDGPRWEIDGIDSDVIRLFSRRSAKIDDAVNERELWSDREKAELGGRLRHVKQPNATWEWVTALWRSTLGDKRLESLTGVMRKSYERADGPPVPIHFSARIALALAAENLAERMAVWTTRELVAEALLAGRGDVNIESIQAELATPVNITGLLHTRDERQVLFTTPRILQDIDSCIGLTTAGKGRFNILGRLPTNLEGLSAEQRRAADVLLGSTDRISVVRVSGTAARAVLDVSRPVLMETAPMMVVGVRPQTVRLLKTHKIENAALVDTILETQSCIPKGTRLWVHDAVFLSARAMQDLFTAANKRDWRIVLVQGDSYRSSVNIGNALRFVTERAKLNFSPPAVVIDAADLNAPVLTAPSQPASDAQGKCTELAAAVAEPAQLEFRKHAAKKFLALARAGAPCAALAPNDALAASWTDVIRSEALSCGRLKAGTQRSIDIISAPPSSVPGDTSHPTQIRAGALGGVHHESAVVRPLEIAIGDQLRVTRTAKVEGEIFIEGETLTACEWLPSGDLRVGKHRILPRGFRHLAYGWVETPTTFDYLRVKDAVLLFEGPGDRQLFDDLKKSVRCTVKRTWSFSDTDGLFLPRSRPISIQPLDRFIPVVAPVVFPSPTIGIPGLAGRLFSPETPGVPREITLSGQYVWLFFPDEISMDRSLPNSLRSAAPATVGLEQESFEGMESETAVRLPDVKSANSLPITPVKQPPASSEIDVSAAQVPPKVDMSLVGQDLWSRVAAPMESKPPTAEDRTPAALPDVDTLLDTVDRSTAMLQAPKSPLPYSKSPMQARSNVVIPQTSESNEDSAIAEPTSSANPKPHLDSGDAANLPELYEVWPGGRSPEAKPVVCSLAQIEELARAGAVEFGTFMQEPGRHPRPAIYFVPVRALLRSIKAEQPIEPLYHVIWPDGERWGPYQAESLRASAAQLKLQPDSLLAVSRTGPGVRACELPELRTLWPETSRPAPSVLTTPEDAPPMPARPYLVWPGQRSRNEEPVRCSLEELADLTRAGAVTSHTVIHATHVDTSDRAMGLEQIHAILKQVADGRAPKKHTYFVMLNGECMGPLEAERLKPFAADNRITRETQVSLSRVGPRLRVCEFPELAIVVGDVQRAKQEAMPPESDPKINSTGAARGGSDAGLSQAAPARPFPMKPETPS